MPAPKSCGRPSRHSKQIPSTLIRNLLLAKVRKKFFTRRAIDRYLPQNTSLSFLMHINSAKFTEPKARFFRDRSVFGPWSPADLGTNLFFDGHRQDRTKPKAQSDMICPSPNRGRFPPKPQMKNKILLEVTAPTRLSAFLESPFPLCRAKRQTSARCL